MPQATPTYLLAHVYANIPPAILKAVFRPSNGRTLDTCLFEEVFKPRVLLDINLLMGKKTRIELLGEWKVPVTLPEFAAVVGATYDASFFYIPPEFREFRNIATVEGISDDYTYAMPVNSGSIGNINNIGNTVTSLANAALSSRTMYNYPIMPQVTLQSDNLIRVYPETYSDGLILECKLEYDEEMTNANQNVIYPLRKLFLNAVKTYCYNEFTIRIDESEVVAGMPIGRFKEIVNSWENEANEYEELLFEVRGGSLMDPIVHAEMISMML